MKDTKLFQVHAARSANPRWQQIRDAFDRDHPASPGDDWIENGRRYAQKLRALAEVTWDPEHALRLLLSGENLKRAILDAGKVAEETEATVASACGLPRCHRPGNLSDAASALLNGKMPENPSWHDIKERFDRDNPASSEDNWSEAGLRYVRHLRMLAIETGDQAIACRLLEGAEKLDRAILEISRLGHESELAIAAACGLRPRERKPSDAAGAGLNAKIPEALILAWRTAGDELGIRVVAPFEDPDFSHRFVAHLADFGGPKGTLIQAMYPPKFKTGRRLTKDICEAGYWLAFINAEYYAKYDAARFKHALTSVAYMTPASTRPAWMPAPYHTGMNACAA